eukprot:3632543-Ditylum_brightwellii.AAC.1
MLLKESGNTLVNKLCAILLFEADYNLITTELIARRLISHAMAVVAILCKHFGGIKCSSSIDVGISCTLHWDILHHHCCAGDTVSVDASNCYGRVVHNIASLSACRLGMPKNAMTSLLTATRLMQYFLRTGHGDSDISYSGTFDDPFHNLCQRNGAAPGLWICVCTLLVLFL